MDGCQTRVIGCDRPCCRLGQGGLPFVNVPVRLYLSYDAGLDWLMAYELGRVDDAQPRARAGRAATSAAFGEGQ